MPTPDLSFKHNDMTQSHENMIQMMPENDPFAQVLCELAASVEISKQLEVELEHIRVSAMRGSANPVKLNGADRTRRPLGAALYAC